jgi:hypothetical protein
LADSGKRLEKRARERYRDTDTDRVQASKEASEILQQVQEKETRKKLDREWNKRRREQGSSPRCGVQS